MKKEIEALCTCLVTKEGFFFSIPFISDRHHNHRRYQDSYYGKRYGSRRNWRHQNYDQGTVSLVFFCMQCLF